MANYNLFDAASLAMVPTGIKDGKLYSVKPDDGSGDFTFSRGTNLAATRVNADGLIEKGRENLLLQSNTFSTTWTTGGLTETSGQSGYDGSSDAWLVENVANGSRFLTQTGLGLDVATFSIYAKAGTTDWISLNNGAGQYAYYDLTNGVLGTIGSSAIDAKIEQVGSTDWYRCSLVVTTANEVRYYLATGNNSLSTVIGDNIYIQDAQLERGLVATDYIETTTAPVQAGITEDLPRIDYTDGCGSLLLEPSRTNLIDYSEYIGASSWTKDWLSQESNAHASPEGLNNASKLTANGSLIDHTILQIHSLSATTYTLSVYVKKDTERYVHLTLNRQLDSNEWATSSFDLDNGKSANYSNDLSIPSSTITPFGSDGWYLITMTATLTDAANTLAFIGFAKSGAPDTSRGRFRTASTDSFYVYGAQLEAGSYPTSYIPTYGTSTSRADDDCRANGIEDYIGQDEGTILVDVDIEEAVNTESYFMRVDASNFSDTIYIVRNTDKSVSGVLRSGNSTIFNEWLPNQSGRIKAALAYKSGDFAFYINGTQVSTSSATYTSTFVYNDITLGEYKNSTAQMSGLMKQALVYKTRLTNNELAALTRPYDTYQEWVDGEGLTWESKSCTTQNIIELQNL